MHIHNHFHVCLLTPFDSVVQQFEGFRNLLSVFGEQLFLVCRQADMVEAEPRQLLYFRFREIVFPFFTADVALRQPVADIDPFTDGKGNITLRFTARRWLFLLSRNRMLSGMQTERPDRL